MQFVADGTVGRLCRWLRLLGLDCEYRADPADARALSLAESRTLLTRSEQLAAKTSGAVLVQGDAVEEQLRGLWPCIKPFVNPLSRCPDCNVRLEGVSREEARGRVPGFTYRSGVEFSRCARCRKIYWEGSHGEGVRARLKQLRRG